MPALHKFVFHRHLYVLWCCVYSAEGYWECVLGVCVSVCHQKSAVAHLVVFRSGLWWQTTGDEELCSSI